MSPLFNFTINIFLFTPDFCRVSEVISVMVFAWSESVSGPEQSMDVRWNVGQTLQRVQFALFNNKYFNQRYLIV